MITNPNVKINLGLNILRKREDGFHDLETLFIPYFGISDTLEIIVGDDYSRTSTFLFAKYGECAQGISEDGKLMITIAREDGIDWDPLKDLTAKAYYILAEDLDKGGFEAFKLSSKLSKGHKGKYVSLIINFIPEFLLLLKGVVDCPDMPLNVSRSFLQNDGYAAKVSAHITKKVADKLSGLFNTERETYDIFPRRWNSFYLPGSGFPRNYSVADV